MAFRTFNDATGREWRVFDVVPTTEERRQYQRRNDEPEEPLDGPDRRIAERRITVGGASRRLSEGWLCFEQPEEPHEQRRLVGVPEDWPNLTEENLGELLGQARTVMATPRSSTPIPRAPH